MCARVYVCVCDVHVCTRVRVYVFSVYTELCYVVRRREHVSGDTYNVQPCDKMVASKSLGTRKVEPSRRSEGGGRGYLKDNTYTRRVGDVAGIRLGPCRP